MKNIDIFGKISLNLKTPTLRITHMSYQFKSQIVCVWEM